MLVSRASPVRLLSELISGVEADEMVHSWVLMRCLPECSLGGGQEGS